MKTRPSGLNAPVTLSAGEGLASTHLSQNLYKQTLLNQQKPKNRLIGQQGAESSQHGEDNSREEFPSAGTLQPSSESSPLSSLHSDDGLEDSITVRGPAPSSRLAPRHTIEAPSTPPVENYPPSSNKGSGEGSEQPSSRRPQRTRKQVEHFQPAPWRAMVARTIEEPQTLGDALASDESSEWLHAWESELKSLQDNETWVIEDLPHGTRAIGCRWIFKLKENGRYKARLVAKGYSQQAGIDYHETFAPVAKFTTLRSLLALAAENDWDIEGMDVKTAFLHGELEEVIYMEIPEGLEQKRRTVSESRDSPIRACRLIKTIYGLKQAPRAWYGKVNTFFSNSGFVRSEEDYSLYVHGTRKLIILLYVDDLVLAALSTQDISWIKHLLSEHFEMTDLGVLTSFIGVQVTRDRDRRTIRISQENYISRVLEDHGMGWCARVTTPIEGGTRLRKPAESYTAEPENRRRYQSVVGSLMYAMLGSRPDIAYAVGLVSQFSTNPDNEHWGAVKHIFRYLAGTKGMGILYGSENNCMGYSDSDWGGSDERRSTSGYTFILNGGAVSWASRKQSVVALSSTEAEYMALTHAIKEVLWLRALFIELGAPLHAKEISTVFCDNQGAIALSKNPGFHARSKHIDIRYHFIRNHVDGETGTINLLYCSTDDMTADVLTKGLPRARHLKHVAGMGLH